MSMQKTNKTPLTLALIVAIGITGAASAAVHLSDDGQGQVLIYPYYTTRAGQDTYLSVLNSTALSKALRVRFNEGKNGREVLSLSVYLAPYDIWTAAVVNTADGAKLMTADKSCTAPALPVDGKSFVNFAYWGAAIEGIQKSGGDGATTSLDRTREGYFEIIEMGTITNTAINAAITHASGVPANCAVVQATTMDMGPASTLVMGGQSARAFKATGGLSGTASLVNVAGGTDFGYAPVVLEAFSPSLAENIWDYPGSIFPDLTFADLTSSVLYKGNVVSSTWNKGSDAISALLMHDSIINEYVLDDTTLSGTDWVITMPTKRYNVPVHDKEKGTDDDTQLLSPFTSKFWGRGSGSYNGACEQIANFWVPPDSWNREGGNYNGLGFPGDPFIGQRLCWETNVATFKDAQVLGSANAESVPVPFEHGWVRMLFNSVGIPVVNGQTDGNGVVHSQAAHSLTSVNGDTYFGLPTVGFMVQDFINQNAAPGVLATYGGNFNHKYTTRISRLPP
ncbi:conserved exported hypothetical protein [Candidatus Nitrotoga sp. HW29]|uniref:hypothetical protein n=1 Tax=Candidatus Nitrotoga sp. HW29 TaxID=2886963 RepID=UPI001EF3C514|nr:hypothetical protein [Candidatus Nitrotoga sp. HW29]CAH1904274.1 conserved exported hypothetical protein [Candidatus Nitrotoga sp. HW29]